MPGAHISENKKGLKNHKITQPEIPGIRLTNKTTSYANKGRLKKY